jgi:hypothetical protein
MKQRNYNGNRAKVFLMRGILGIVLATAGLSTFASQSVELTWTPSGSPDVVGYNIYYGPTSGVYTSEISVGNTTNATISGLLENTTNYFAAKAINSEGIESAYSIQTSYVVPSSAAIFGRPVFSSNRVSITMTGVPGYVYVLQASTDLLHWISLETNFTPLEFTDTNPSRYSRRFYRAIYLF